MGDFTTDIISRIKSREWGLPVMMDPKYIAMPPLFGVEDSNSVKEVVAEDEKRSQSE